MWVDLDPTTGDGRLDDEGREALVSSLRGAIDATSMPARFTHPALRARLAAITDPLVELDMVVAGRNAHLHHHAWVKATDAVIALAVRDDLHQLLVVPPGHLAASLARMARLTVRRDQPRADKPWPRSRSAELVHPDVEVRTRALADTDTGGSFAWHLEVLWGEGSPGLTGVDGPDGLFLVDPHQDVLHPVSNSTAYRLFSSSLSLAALQPAH